MNGTWQMKHALTVMVLLALSSCAFPMRHEASEVEIKHAATRYLTKREPWAAKAQLTPNARQDAHDGTWRVKVNALDPRPTECGCIPFIPGTGRELLFSRSGAFISCVPLR